MGAWVLGWAHAGACIITDLDPSLRIRDCIPRFEGQRGTAKKREASSRRDAHTEYLSMRRANRLDGVNTVPRRSSLELTTGARIESFLVRKTVKDSGG